MDQIIAVVGEVYTMQLEVDAAIRAITVRRSPGLSDLFGRYCRAARWLLCSYSVACLQDDTTGILPAMSSLGSSTQVELSTDFVNSLTDSMGGAMDDGVLTPEELQADPEGQALLAALQQQIADEAGVDPSQVSIEGLNVDGSGRRLQQGGGKLVGWAFCPTVESCTVDVAYQ